MSLESMENKSKEMVALESARELLIKLQNSDSNNPNAHRTRINSLVLEIRELENNLKTSGELPVSDLEKVNILLDRLYPNAKSKTTVEHEGMKYRIQYFPSQKSRSGKTVQEWGHLWNPIK